MKNTILSLTLLILLSKFCFCSLFFCESPRHFVLCPILAQETQLTASGNEILLKTAKVAAKDMYFRFKDDNYYSICGGKDSIAQYEYIQEGNTLTLNNQSGISIYIDFANLVYCLEICDSKTFGQIIIIGIVNAEI